MNDPSQLAAAQRLLIVRPSALGDVCRTVPVLATLRRAFPAAQIDWLVQDNFAEAIESHPDLSAAVAFPRGRFARWWRSPAIAREILAWVFMVRRHRYGVVYDFQGLGRSGAMARFSGAPRRVGYRDAREFGWLGYNVRHPPPRATHIVDQMLELLERNGLSPVRDMRLHAPPSANSWWEEQRHRLDLSSGDYAILAPTSRWQSKRWPIERWAALIEPLQARGFERAIVVGGPGEEAQVGPLFAERDSRVIDMVGNTSVGQTMAMIQHAALVIANDSAPLHMAVGFDRPLVGLFGPTDPAFVGPYQRDDSIVRVFDPARDSAIHFRKGEGGGELMSRITIPMVVEKIDSVVRNGRPQTREATTAGLAAAWPAAS